MENVRDFDENGSLVDFPKGVFSFYGKRFDKTITPLFLENLVGKSYIDIQNYDIYIMGKRKGEKENCFWTKLRLLSSESSRNSIQGLLEVQFLAGYGHMNTGSNLNPKIMRPTNIQQIVTKDSVAFKKRAIVHVKEDVFLPLEGIDSHIRIPLMDEETLSKFEKASNSRKREAYARKKASKNEWAHVNRITMKKEHKKLIIRMVTPYKKNLKSNEYWVEFLNDLFSECMELKQEFTQDVTDDDKKELLEELTKKVMGNAYINNNIITDDDNNNKRRRQDVTLPDVNDPDKYISTKRSLRNIPSTDISW